MRHKITNKLFNGQYQYKVVLLCAGAALFRSADVEVIAKKLAEVDLDRNNTRVVYRNTSIRTLDDLNYANNLLDTLRNLSDYSIRIESPWISFYSNKQADIDTLIALGEDHVKYVCAPPDDTKLEVGTIVMSKRDYDYRITLGRTTQTCDSFIEWADANSTKIQLTRGCRKDLLKPRSYGGSYFYLTGDNVLLMARMHLGSSITKVERIIKK